jgi:hypothetical protein
MHLGIESNAEGIYNNFTKELYLYFNYFVSNCAQYYIDTESDRAPFK